MIDSVTKPKLRKGLSYVLKTSQLEQALIQEGIDCHVSLHYWVPQCGGSILEAEYWLPNPNVPYPRVYIRAGVVTSPMRVAASQALLELGLPRFIEWLRHIVNLPETSPELHSKPYFDAQFTETGLNITHHATYKSRKRG